MSAVIKARFSLILHDRPCLNTIAICLEMIVGRRREGKFRVGRDELEGTSETDQYLHRRKKGQTDHDTNFRVVIEDHPSHFKVTV